MSGKHTPGPWVLDGHNLSSIIHCVKERGNPEAKHLCGDYETIARCEDENWKANARLIAAAPDLLEALEMCLDCLAENGVKEAQEKARAAIEKATGAA